MNFDSFTVVDYEMDIFHHLNLCFSSPIFRITAGHICIYNSFHACACILGGGGIPLTSLFSIPLVRPMIRFFLIII